MFNDMTSQMSGGWPDSNVGRKRVDTSTSMTPVDHDNFRGRVMARRTS
jgi:hypothetical protein